MSIKFLCPHCKKVMSVKDEFAGRKGKCPHCTKVLTVPVPAKPAAAPAAAARPAEAAAAPPQAAPPPPPPVDVEAAAAAALVDEPKADGPPPEPTTIDFDCPMCGEKLHLPLTLAGKREPCPECRRIIKVPELEKKDPTNWRKVDQSLPSGARRPEQKAPEGAWGSAAGAATVSRDALRDAGAIPDAKVLLTVRQRIVRYATWAGIGVFVAVIAVLGYLKWLETREAKALDAALTYADSDAGKSELGRDGRAALRRLAGEYYLRQRASDSAKNARDQFEKSLGLLGPATDAAGSAAERDALLQDLALAEMGLGGSSQEVDAGLKLKWDDVQKELHAALRDMRSSEARMEALREVARGLAKQGEGERATALASSLYPSPNKDRAEALSAVGLELLAAKVKGLPEKVADQVQQMYAVEKDRPALAPAAVALAVALNREPPEPAKKGSKWLADDKTYDPLGRAEGLAYLGKGAEARSAAEGLPNAEVQLEAYVALAAAPGAKPDDATNAIGQVAGAKKASPWLLLRLARIGARAGVAPDALRSVADAIADPDLRGRAQLAALEAQLAQTKQAADPKVLDGVDAPTLSARLAREELARHNIRYSSGMAGVVKSWEPPNRAFGLLGVALGSQGEE